MVNIVLKIALFLTSNLLGMWMHAITFWIILSFGMDFTDRPGLVQIYSLQVMGTWIICALFSFAFFFLKSGWRHFFLLAPAVIPFLFGMVLPVFY